MARHAGSADGFPSRFSEAIRLMIRSGLSNWMERFIGALFRCGTLWRGAGISPGYPGSERLSKDGAWTARLPSS